MPSMPIGILAPAERLKPRYTSAARPGPADATASAKASQIFSERNGWLDGSRPVHLEMQFLENRISDLKGQDFLLVEIHTARHDWLTYINSGRDVHENTLNSSETLGAKGRRYLVPWARWHKTSDYDQAGHYIMLPERDGPRVIQIRHHDMTINLPNTKDVQWETTLTIDPLMDNLRAMRLLIELFEKRNACERQRQIVVRRRVGDSGNRWFDHRSVNSSAS